MSLLRRPRDLVTAHPATTGTLDVGNLTSIIPGDTSAPGVEVRGIFSRNVSDASTVGGYSLIESCIFLVPSPPGFPYLARTRVVDADGVVWEVEGDPIVRRARMRNASHVRVRLRRVGSGGEVSG